MSFNSKVSVRDYFRLESILFFPLLLLITCIHTQSAWRVNRDWLKCLEIKLVKRKYKCADMPHHHEISCHLFTNLPLSTFSSIWSKFAEKNSAFLNKHSITRCKCHWEPEQSQIEEEREEEFTGIFWHLLKASELILTVHSGPALLPPLAGGSKLLKGLPYHLDIVLTEPACWLSQNLSSF